MRQKVKAKIVRTVTEVATVILDNDGCVEEILDIHEEIDTDDIEVLSVHTILSEW